MYCINGNSSWYSDCGPLFGGCPLLGVSVIGGSTVYLTLNAYSTFSIEFNSFVFTVSTVIVYTNFLSNLQSAM
jgi:hypothetical protein